MRRRRSASSRRRRSASARAAAMRSRRDMCFQSLAEAREDARSSSRPRLPRRESARSALDERRSALSLRESDARSRRDERESLLDEAVSRPPRFEDFEDAAAFFAAPFFEAACAPAGLNRKIAETASAIRQGNRNFRVIEPSSLKNQAEAVAGGVLKVNGGRRAAGSND
jgi:hypothetical protein